MEKQPNTRELRKVDRFIQEYIKCQNGAQAVIKAGYRAKNAKNASIMATNILSRPHVRAKIAEVASQLMSLAQTDALREIREAQRIAFSDVGQMFDENGNLLPVDKMPEDIRHAIASFEVEILYEKNKPIGTVTKVKLWDKNAALEKLFKYRRLYAEPGTHDNPIHLVHHIDFSKLSLSELNRLDSNPELVLSTRN